MVNKVRNFCISIIARVLIYVMCWLIDWLIISQFNGTSIPKGSYRAKIGDNDCNVTSSRYSLRTALCENIRYKAKSEQNVQQNLIPRVRHGEAAFRCPELRCSMLKYIGELAYQSLKKNQNIPY